MKLTFLINKDVGYYEGEQLHIARGLKGDYFFVEDTKEAKRLSELREMGRLVFKSDAVKQETVEKEIQKEKEVQEEIKKKAETLDSSDIRDLYEAKTGKKFPPNKTRKNKDTGEIWIDEEWARKKLEELEKGGRMD